MTALGSAKPAGSAWGGRAGLRQGPQRTHPLEGSRPPRPWESAGRQPWLKGQRQAERQDPGTQASRSREVRRGEARPDVAKETPGVPLTVRAPPLGCCEPAGPVPGARGLTCTNAPPERRYAHGAPSLRHEELPRALLSPSSPEPAPCTGALGAGSRGPGGGRVPSLLTQDVRRVSLGQLTPPEQPSRRGDRVGGVRGSGWGTCVQAQSAARSSYTKLTNRKAPRVLGVGMAASAERREVALSCGPYTGFPTKAAGECGEEHAVPPGPLSPPIQLQPQAWGGGGQGGCPGVPGAAP